MNKTPNPNYPLPEKWYVQRTKKNSIKVNNLCSQILKTDLIWGNIPSDHRESHFTPYIHSVFSTSKKKCFTEPQEGYTEVTYEDLWLAYMISEKWYCLNASTTLLNRWRRLNGSKDLCMGGRNLVLSRHDRDDSYFWGGNLSGLKETTYYNDYKEISLEDFATFLDILEQKENTKPMGNNTPTEVIIPITEFTKIVNVACPTWQKKLKDYVISNLQDDCISVKVIKNFYNQMIAASITRGGINQADVINSVLPMFRPDPYQVFKDAEKEGRIVQFLGANDKWISSTEKWSYEYPPERYRIKHKHQDLIDEWEASSKSKKVQFKDFSTKGEWVDLDNNAIIWDEISEYRFKPETEYVPFEDSEIQQLMGEWIKHKVTGEMIMITEVYPPSHGGGITVKVVGGWTSLHIIFDQYTFLDGSPCGKLVTE